MPGQAKCARDPRKYRAPTPAGIARQQLLLPLWMIIFGVSLLRHSPAILIRQPI
jgi:hypothetical protein